MTEENRPALPAHPDDLTPESLGGILDAPGRPNPTPLGSIGRDPTKPDEGIARQGGAEGICHHIPTRS